MYWAQHCYPADARTHAVRIDTKLLQTAQNCIPTLEPDLDISDATLRRLRLPSIYYGCGLRTLEDVTPAAFVGTICQIMPRMIDRMTANGEIASGFLTCLGPLLGTGSFDAGAEDRPAH